jgi:hypothetical protein
MPPSLEREGKAREEKSPKLLTSVFSGVSADENGERPGGGGGGIGDSVVLTCEGLCEFL